jgi:hypothetical protein
MKHPREAALHEKLLVIARKLKEAMPPGVGFTLFMFEFGKGGFTSYLSTAERADMIRLVKEWLKVQEAEVQKPEGSGS